MTINENLLGGPPPTMLPDDVPARTELEGGADAYDVVRRHPESSLAWASLADAAWQDGRVVESYAFARVGYHLIEARNAVEGHFLWRQHGGPTGGINLVLTDMIMPGSTGRELAARLRAEHANVPVLFISGYLEGGMSSDDDPLTTRYLEKPFTSRRLLDEVLQLLVRNH